MVDAHLETAASTPADVIAAPIQGGEVLVFVDRWISGMAGGGIRFNVSGDRFELAHLARTMSLKYGFVNFPMGGAKTGIVASRPDSREARARLLESVGHALAPLAGRYFPGRDVGFGDSDLAAVLKGMGTQVRKKVDTASYTGLTVAIAADAWARHTGRNLSAARVAIEGLGGVGGSAARHLVRRGCRLVGVSTAAGALDNPSGLDLDLLLKARGSGGEDFLRDLGVGTFSPDPAQLLSTDCDLLVLCGLSWSLNRATAELLKCAAVVPGANCPATDVARERLAQRGVWLVPDFAANCGGVVGSAFERLGLRPQEVEKVLERDIGSLLRSLMTEADLRGHSLEEIARARAERNIQARLRHRASGWMMLRPFVERAWMGALPRPVIRALGVPLLRRTVRAGS